MRVCVVPEALAYTVCVVHACSPSHALVVDVVAASSIVPGASLKIRVVPLSIVSSLRLVANFVVSIIEAESNS